MLHDQTVFAFSQQAQALLGQLAKAESWCADHGIAESDFLGTRLAADMRPLSGQLNFVVAELLKPMRHLTGQALPDPADALPTIASHRARISAALAVIGGLRGDQVDGDPARRITLELPNGMAFDMSAADYVRDWAVPQFFFHIMAAYALMRHNGVPLGKADFVPHMARHARRPAQS
ncbi:MAG: hypothetical protein RLZZ58_2168 [Pseudomonadota bacterium]